MVQQKYFPIETKNIKLLENNRCYAEDWSRVLVTADFDPQRVRDVVFEGEVKIGSLTKELELADGTRRSAGIYRSRLQNITIGNNCYISNVHQRLSNLHIGPEVIIENVGLITCTGETSFGNGHDIAVLNEAGGRELKITRLTSAQIANLTVLYRDHNELIRKLNQLAEDYSKTMRNHRASIGDRSQITNSQEIVNVHIEEGAIINGAYSLKEGTVDSSLEAPTVVGNGVIAEHFIFQKGSSVTNGAMIFSSLVGEGTQIGKQFLSENSTFFANSEGFLSEVCSVFAGPYSVTHHKSTLLIAGMFSFYNAGSGTNQSNHMYKLGPVHQGIIERGCKTGSSSYLLWPSRVGAFTAIIGKHYANFDSGDLPFSYISEVDGKSTIVPGMNFFTAGTLRDGIKWPARDRRKSSAKLDLIIFNILSPYTVQKMIRGQKLLSELYATTEKNQEYVNYNGIHIKRLLLKTCSRYYSLAIDKYLGDVVIHRIETKGAHHIHDVLNYEESGVSGNDEWLDISGLLCAKSRIDKLITEVVSGKIASMEQLYHAFKMIYNAYHVDEWNWFLTIYKKLNQCEFAEATPEKITELFNRWKESTLKLLNMVLQDTQKEFEGHVRIGFGIGGNADADFESVRGTFDKNAFVQKIRTDIEEVNRKYETMLTLIHSS